MFERFRNRDDYSTDPAYTGRNTVVRHDGLQPGDVRGGVSAGAILTGVVVAFGAMALLSVLIIGVLVALGLVDENITQGDLVDAGIGAAIALIVAQFLAYMWGGYTAGRMARGSGVANGILVALTAIIVAVCIGAIATAVGANANVDLPFRLNLPFSPQDVAADADAQEVGLGMLIAALAAMFLGGALGGALGSRWHTKLERAHYDEVVESRTVDLRDRDVASSPTTTTAAPAATPAAAPAGTTTGTGRITGKSTEGTYTPTTTSEEAPPPPPTRR